MEYNVHGLRYMVHGRHTMRMSMARRVPPVPGAAERCSTGTGAEEGRGEEEGRRDRDARRGSFGVLARADQT
jgi:hypothetical protein